jgi:hypothetical protein
MTGIMVTQHMSLRGLQTSNCPQPKTEHPSTKWPPKHMHHPLLLASNIRLQRPAVAQLHLWHFADQAHPLRQR